VNANASWIRRLAQYEKTNFTTPPFRGNQPPLKRPHPKAWIYEAGIHYPGLNRQRQGGRRFKILEELYKKRYRRVSHGRYAKTPRTNR